LNDSTNKLIEQNTAKDNLIKQMSLKEEDTHFQFDGHVESIRVGYEKEKETIRLGHEKQITGLTNKIHNLENQIKSYEVEIKALEEKAKLQEESNSIKLELTKANDKLIKSEADNISTKEVYKSLQAENEKLLESIAFEKQQYKNLKTEVFRS
jgi:hypothetical protein